jgi:hypothetical protein
MADPIQLSAHEWLVTFHESDEERVPAQLGGTDVGAMQVGERAYLVISDSDNRAVWMRDAADVKGVKRCLTAGTGQPST